MKTLMLLTACGAAALFPCRARATDPLVSSWFTLDSGRYARVYTNAAAQSARTPAVAWSNGSQNQTLPAYSGIQEVDSSASWVYLRSTGLGSHVMGPWSVGFPNFPINTKTLYRLPRTTSVSASKTLTGLGAIGYFVDGVAMFDSRDGFYWNGTTEANGNGSWNRDAYVNEKATFDPAYAHQPNSGMYHYHASPIALRFLLGDHVDFDSASQTYSESAGPPTHHSPLLGWMSDGFPLYGPYGYSNPTNPTSGIRRMISGYVLRDGQNGTQDLTVTGRTNIPAWAVRLYGSTTVAGPNVSASYPLGRYLEDNDYLGDLGKTQGVDFDLDQYNGRWCVTPEFPGGTYAYFVSIAADGTPIFPYIIGRAFYGMPKGGSASSITESVVTNFIGGPNAAPQLNTPLADQVSGDILLTWSAAEGGTYLVQSANDFGAWNTVATNLLAQGNAGQTKVTSPSPHSFYRVARTGLADFDPVSGSAGQSSSGGIASIAPTSAARGTTFSATITLSTAANPQVPPQNAPINSLTLGTTAGTSATRPTQYTVQATFTIPANAAIGAQTVTIVFPGPPSDPTATITYTLADGFTVL